VVDGSAAQHRLGGLPPLTSLVRRIDERPFARADEHLNAICHGALLSTSVLVRRGGDCTGEGQDEPGAWVSRLEESYELRQDHVSNQLVHAPEGPDPLSISRPIELKGDLCVDFLIGFEIGSLLWRHLDLERAVDEFGSRVTRCVELE